MLGRIVKKQTVLVGKRSKMLSTESRKEELPLKSAFPASTAMCEEVRRLVSQNMHDYLQTGIGPLRMY